MARPGMPYRADIDGLRAVAIATVLAFHALPGVVPGGFVGVDVFFVVSGYLITALVLSDLDRGRFSLAGFYARRARRILPALLLMLALCLAFAWYALLPSEFRWLGRSLAWCAPFLADFFFAHATGYFDPGADYNLLLHLWSLGVEEQFYLLWPLLLLVAQRQGLTRAVIAAAIAASLAIGIWGAWNAPAPHFFLPTPRIWELGAGALLAAWPSTPTRSACAACAGAAASSIRLSLGYRLRAPTGLALIAGAAAGLASKQAYPGIWALLPVLGTVLLIAADPQAFLTRRVLSAAPLVRLGRISYPLYLLHWPVLAFMRSLWGPVLSAPTLIGALAACLGAAALSERLLELPLRRGAGLHAVPVMFAALAAFTALGAAIASGGIPARLSGSALQAWDAAVQDWSLPPLSGDPDLPAHVQVFALRGHGRGTTLYIGDSHMQQYWPRAAAVLATRADAADSALFFTAAGCPALPGLNSLRRAHPCAEFFSAAARRALQPDIDTVVFGSFWEAYLLGEYGTGEREAVYRAGDPLQRRLEWDSATTEQAFAGLESLCALLTASGHRVFILLSNPTSPQLEPRWLLPPRIRLGLEPPGAIAREPGVDFDASGFEAHVARVHARLLGLAGRSGAQALDPRSTLCSGMRCPARSTAGTPLYIDSNHLRSGFARSGAAFLDVTLLR